MAFETSLWLNSFIKTHLWINIQAFNTWYNIPAKYVQKSAVRAVFSIQDSSSFNISSKNESSVKNFRWLWFLSNQNTFKYQAVKVQPLAAGQMVFIHQQPPAKLTKLFRGIWKSHQSKITSSDGILCTGSEYRQMFCGRNCKANI